MADERYPRWRQRWEERAHDIDNEIKSWWQSTKADLRETDNLRQAAAAAANETQPAGEHLAVHNDLQALAELVSNTSRNWWDSVQMKVADWFEHEDAEAKAEYNQAWNDDDYIHQRFEERKAALKDKGELK